MKTITFRNRTIGIVITVSAAAVLMFGLSNSRPNSTVQQQTRIAAQPAHQVADGSESNGGGSKGGGKGSAKLSNLA